MDATLILFVFKYLFVTILSCVFIVYLYCYFFVYNYWKHRNVQSAETIFIFGNLSFLMRKSLSEFFHELAKKYPVDYVGIYLFWKPAIVVQSPEIAKRVLQTENEYFMNRYLEAGDSDPLGSLNLFTVKDPLWSSLRMSLSPMFTSARLKTVTELMNLNSKELVKRIKREYIDNKKPVHLKELFTMYASDIVASTVFGLKTSALNNEKSPLWVISLNMVKWQFWRGFEFTMIFLAPFVAKFLRLTFFSKTANDYIKKLFNGVVEERKKSHISYDKDLVNHLLKLKPKMMELAEKNQDKAENMMLAQVAVFILGSIETSSTVLSYVLHELAHHPEEQEKVYQEIKIALLSKENDTLEYDDLLELKYLTSCIFETMRKHAPVPYLDRICSKDFKLNDQVTIKKGTPVLINVIGLHNNEKIYPEPNRWWPERISLVADNDNMQFSLIPFGEGPRFCIGKRFGLMQIRAALAQLIVNYKLTPAEIPYHVTPDPYSPILSPKYGGKVIFIPRI